MQGSNIDLELEKGSPSKIALNRSISRRRLLQQKALDFGDDADLHPPEASAQGTPSNKPTNTQQILPPPIKIIDADTAQVKPFQKEGDDKG